MIRYPSYLTVEETKGSGRFGVAAGSRARAQLIYATALLYYSCKCERPEGAGNPLCLDSEASCSKGRATGMFYSYAFQSKHVS